MPHTTTNAKAPTPCTATGAFDESTNDLNYATAERRHKTFSTLVAGFALKGYTLQRTNAGDGPVTYYATRLGQVRYLHSLDDAQRYLAQMGGAV
jgi:hypothetical protein